MKKMMGGAMTTAPVLFRNVMIFDGSGEGLFPGEVLVEGNRIAAVGRRGHPVTATSATVIDGGGATLMPGLIEPHAHLTFTSAVRQVVRYSEARNC